MKRLEKKGDKDFTDKFLLFPDMISNPLEKFR